jgi:hypothetical protein
MTIKTFCAILLCQLGGSIDSTAMAEVPITGTVNFANAAALVDARVVLKGSGVGVSGADWKVQLLLQTSTNLVPIAGPFSFESGSLSGYFFTGSISVPGTAPGDSATFRIRIQNVITHFVIDSDPVAVVLGGNIMPPANLIGLASLEVPGPVSLSVTNSGSDLILSWPIWAANMSLQVSAEFPPTWRNSPTARNTNQTSIWTTVDLLETSEFFRLTSD